MPELPEVETVRRGLAAASIGRRVARAELRRADFLEVGGAGRGGASRGVSRGDAARLLLEGARIARLERKGKQIAVVAAEGPCLVVQLGMSGEVLVSGGGEQADGLDHVHARWELEDGTLVRFRDPRRFGGLTWYPSFESVQQERWSELGPDALSIDAEALARALDRTTRHVKVALLDQGLVAGVGNIYADEALHRAGIGPRRRSDRLGAPELARLAAAIREVMGEALGAGGSTIRGYRDPAGAAGIYQGVHRVYGRGGQACLTCGRTLRQASIGQRTTVWCPGCQGGKRAMRGGDGP